MNILWLFFSFNGRINRAKYWLGWVGAYAFGAGFMLGLGPLLPQNNNAVSFIFGLVALSCSVSFLAITWKRLHDLTLSGWWTQAPLAVLLVPLIVTGSYFDDIRYSLGVMMIYHVLFVVCVIWLGCIKGVVGPNRYGPDPLDGIPHVPQAISDRRT